MKVHGAGLVCGALYSALKLTGDEGGEDKDEGRVRVRSDNHLKHHKRPRRRGIETWIGHGKGGIIPKASMSWF